jgi:hypothetical protein
MAYPPPIENSDMMTTKDLQFSGLLHCVIAQKIAGLNKITVRPVITLIMEILGELLHKVLAGNVGVFYCCYLRFKGECNKITEKFIRKSSTVFSLGNIKKQHLNVLYLQI